jgi:hypothetical protein
VSHLKDKRRIERFQGDLLELTARLMAAEQLPPHKVKDELTVAVGLAYCVASNIGVPDATIMEEVERLSRGVSRSHRDGP